MKRAQGNLRLSVASPQIGIFLYKHQDPNLELSQQPHFRRHFRRHFLAREIIWVILAFYFSNRSPGQEWRGRVFT
jgi:hypothetical protein